MAFPFQAVLFDMDGTLTDNRHWHDLAWQQFSREHLGLDLPLGDERFHGGTTVKVIEHLLGRSLPQPEAMALHDLKEDCYRRLAQGQLQALPGLMPYLQRLEEYRVPCALVSNAAGENLPFTLEQLGLSSAFDVIIDGTMCAQAKPHPDMYLLACERLGVEPWECLVHEDSAVGIQAGRAASCRVAVMTTSMSEDQALQLGANWAAADFHGWMQRIVWSSW